MRSSFTVREVAAWLLGVITVLLPLAVVVTVLRTATAQSDRGVADEPLDVREWNNHTHAWSNGHGDIICALGDDARARLIVELSESLGLGGNVP